MPIGVLGPVEVEGHAFAPRERAILATLVLRRGSHVAGDEFAEAYWQNDPPATWWQQVKTSIARIRDALGSEVIATVPGGYVFGLDPGVIDAVRFERLIEAARADVAREDSARAVDRFEHALSLWRSAPFPELQGWGPGVLETMRLTEVRAGAEEELVAARLDAGESSSVIPEAQRLVGNAPFREERWALLALANYRSGRQGDALAVIREARVGLSRELGIAPGARLTDLASAMLRQDPALEGRQGLIQASDDCPYRGLAAFDSDSADIYFGREADIAACLPRIRSGAILAIIGPSGSGKSSLLNAGLVPAIRASGRAVRVTQPRARLDVVLRELGLTARPDTIIAIDQFEELFALDPTVRDEVVQQLVELRAQGAALVLTIRSDFLDAAISLPTLGVEIGRGVVAVAPLSLASLREAIERPARLAALRLEPGLVELILRDAGDRTTALPHLSHALVETWLRREGSTLTVDGYDAAGGLAGAIALTAEKRYRALSPSEQDACRTILLRLIEVTEDGAAVRRRLPLSTARADAIHRVVVEALVAARLLTIEADAVTVSHESIAHAWPRLMGWLDADAESGRIMRRLEASASAWDDAGRPADELQRGPRLAATLAWRRESRPILSAVESEFLAAAETEEQTRAAALEERARRDRRQNRRLRALLGSAAGLLVIALVAAGIAIVRGRDAGLAEADARIEALTATAESLVATDRDAAALIAAELYREQPTDVRVRSALLSVVATTGAPVEKVSFAADQRIFATPIPGTLNVLVATSAAGNDDGHLTLEIRDMTSGDVVRTLAAELPAAPTERWGTALVNPSGTRALLVYGAWSNGAPGDCCTTVLATVDLGSGQVVAGPKLVDLLIGGGGTFTADGSMAVVSGEGSDDPVWIDPGSLSVSRSRLSEEGQPPTIGLATDGSVLVGTAQRVDVRDPSTHEVRDEVILPGRFGSNSLRALPDGGFLTAGPDGVARVNDRGEIVWTARDSDCEDLVDIAERGTFVCLRNDGTISEARLSDGFPTGRSFAVQAEWVMAIDSLSDGSIVAINQRTVPSISRFAVDGSGTVSRLVAADRVATGFADDGTIIVTDRDADPLSDPPAAQQLWDLATDRPVGAPQAEMIGLGGGVVATWKDASAQFELSRPGESRTWHLSGGVLDQLGPLKLAPGSTDDRAFAIASNWIAPFDPRTGALSGPVLSFAGARLLDYWVMVHDIPGRDEAVVSWWSADESQMVTAVYNLGTGDEVARGLYGDVASVGLPDGRIASTTSSELRRSTDTLIPIDSLAKPVAGANQFELSRDGRLLLLQGASQPASLYDVATGVKLGGDIATDSPSWGSAHLAPNGLTLVTNSTAGVLVWNLDPAAQAIAACRSTGRTLTPTEWRAYFGDAPQVDTCALLEPPTS